MGQIKNIKLHIVTDIKASNCHSRPLKMATQISKKRKFVADGVFKAELNEFLKRELAEDGYSGVEVRVTPLRTEIIILATRTQNVLGEKGRRIRELTSVVQKRFNFPEGTVELYAEKVAFRGLCAIAQCESLRYKLLAGAPVERHAMVLSDLLWSPVPKVVRLLCLANLE